MHLIFDILPNLNRACHTWRRILGAVSPQLLPQKSYNSIFNRGSKLKYRVWSHLLSSNTPQFYSIFVTPPPTPCPLLMPCSIYAATVLAKSRHRRRLHKRSGSHWSTLSMAFRAIGKHGGQQNGGRIPTGAAHVKVDQSTDGLYQAPMTMSRFRYIGFFSMLMKIDIV
jgi:hypothetical protein